MAKQRVAVYIGRFQPLHRGHAYVLQHCFDNYDKVVVLIGSAHKARDIKNPFTFDERAALIRQWLGAMVSRRCVIRPLRDRRSNAAWIASVHQEVREAVGDDCEITVCGSDRDSSTWYLNAFPHWGRDLVTPYENIPGLAATQLREHLFTTGAQALPGALDHVQEFLQQFTQTDHYHRLVRSHAHLKKYRADTTGPKGHAPHFMCADAVVIQSGHILVVRRAQDYGYGLLALPGGFVKPGQTLREAAIAELMEETGIRLTNGKRAKEITEGLLNGAIIDTELFDEDGRSLRGRTFTMAHTFRLDDSKPLPLVGGQPIPEGEEGAGQPETLSAEWMLIGDALAQPENWFEDHHSIVETMYARI